MRKEILLAIFVGITLGLMITFGIYQNSENAKTGQNNDTDQLINNPVGSESAAIQDPQLMINSPEEDFFTNEEDLIVSGSASPNSFVVVLVNDSESISNTDESGNFSIKVKLNEGGNLIEINSIDEDGKKISKQRTVIYEVK
ncbi:MAG: hypothetical protein UT13_C0001G0762 [Candidatus Pacebacteria bacterium GW2011_GWF2_38_9]|nr:MAG: hypothetical protein US01_C0001G0797 [candidate division TM6 bacterium GW2011_GWF2_28_16]KKQ08855.1 MAG: hypothetical protein US20_C0011G0024 [Candidatus Pacebacteria bacterium GW2011_GWF1_36_5]KKQ89114.1 MAG: hypothetical protein UT13_C0001G0762 [Candidatus Pacebacteria bacterium GW2011_GWF2_38_9]HAZ73614.1 hypothetical protein [Candidatus Paceibacterota bacterium]